MDVVLPGKIFSHLAKREFLILMMSLAGELVMLESSTWQIMSSDIDISPATVVTIGKSSAEDNAVSGKSHLEGDASVPVLL